MLCAALKVLARIDLLKSNIYYENVYYDLQSAVLVKA